MSSSTKSHRLLTLELRIEQDIVFARQRARQLVSALGFEPLTETRIATALSEIARNAFQYAKGGRVEFFVLTEPVLVGPRRVRQTLVISVRDTGPGIIDLEGIMAGRYRSPSGLGLGIVSTHRLMDRVEITTSPAGTVVTLAKIFPPSIPPLSPEQLQAVMDRIARAPVSTPFEEVQVQNQELIRALEDARAREEELARVNQELAETNAGVLALYDELETLHRIGTMLASKLELKPLIQSIIDVTTSLTDAEIGAFYFQSDKGQWSLYATSGPKADDLSGLKPDSAVDLFGPDFAATGLIHLADLEHHPESAQVSRFATTILQELGVRSCLIVPVLKADQALLGSLVFTSRQSKAFTERSERILSSVATQAAIGIEKAQLFQNVTAANEAKDQFFAALSHELRTPLNPALAIISSLQTDPRLPAELLGEIAIVARNIRLEARLIDDLLDFNRLIKGKLQLAVAPMRLYALLDDVIAICREELEAKFHRLQLDLKTSDLAIVADPARLQQVLWNVLKNAIKFTDAGGTITVVAAQTPDSLEISIADTGRGIEPAALSRIFDAFDQGENRLAAHFGGLGLGLTIARMFVELHGGKIAAQSAGLNFGTTIIITLPKTEVPAASTQPAPARLTTVSEGTPRRILVIDDHVDTLYGLVRLLTRRGFEVTPAESGQTARAAAETGKFDIIISDLGLTDCSGLDLLKDLRTTQNCPAIALSGYGMEADLANSKQAGFQMHITKPVDFGHLIDSVATLLDQPQ